MGREIEDSHFKSEDFQDFSRQLQKETQLLCQWIDEGRFPVEKPMGGFELEAVLFDQEGQPAPIANAYLERVNSPLVVPELATFNVEINSQPRLLHGTALSDFSNDLNQTVDVCQAAAKEMGARFGMVGILPTAKQADFTLANMTPLHRYRALNEQVLKLRGGEPLKLDIEGRNRLCLERQDLMMESATTSFQIHLKVNVEQGARFYNASKIISAPMVAVAANSPYLFGADLWDETRIPLFEQAVAVGKTEAEKRVTFGISYLDSIADYFLDNCERFSVLLPRLSNEPEERFAHLLLHNGTIWRWNRVLVGFGVSGHPHIRIEHRSVPAGPTVTDSIANAAFFFGAVTGLAAEAAPVEKQLSFQAAHDNFYRCAKHGLGAEIQWLQDRNIAVSTLCSEWLLPKAQAGLLSLGIDSEEADHWLGIIRARVESGQNGAKWQRAWVKKHGLNMQGLLDAYLEQQTTGRPVHEWRL